MGAILWWAGTLHAEFRDLTDLGIEELMAVQATSVDEKIRELSDSAITVSVVGGGNLRRPDFICVPDSLYMVPGLNMAHCRYVQGKIQTMKFPPIDPGSRSCDDGYSANLLTCHFSSIVVEIPGPVVFVVAGSQECDTGNMMFFEVRSFSGWVG